ncbi:MAG: hypothetical protein P4L50_26400 [Anaerolineaceae bacterium]|nr:hypothetical protein [Anaerolineaceae bacterium]
MGIKRFYHTIVLGLIALLLVSCTLARRGASAGGSASITFTTPAATIAPTQIVLSVAGSKQAVNAIINAAKAQITAKSWRVKSNIESNQVTIQGTLDYVAPDRYHLTTSTIDMISIGPKSYINQNGKWLVSPLNVTGLISTLMNSALPQDLENNITNAKQLNPDTLNGNPMKVYQFDNTFTQNNINITTTTKLWVGAGDGLPYHEVIQGNINGVQAVTTNQVVYDPSIQIEDPTAK